MIPDTKILAQFKKVYEKEFRTKIGDQETSDRWGRLVGVLRLLVRPASSTSNSDTHSNEKESRYCSNWQSSERDYCTDCVNPLDPLC